MFGYVREYPPELKLKHHVFYRAVYCGVCKSMGHCTGFCSRATLSYDMVFLALVRMALEKMPYEVEPQRCILHPFGKHPVMNRNAVLDYSARVSALLFYGKTADDLMDTHGVKKLFIRMARPFAAHFQKRAGLDVLTECVQKQLASLSTYETQECASIDLPADCFGALCAECFSFGLDAERKTLAGSIGRHVGRWIYAADALDDFEKDKKTGSYNPILRLYGENLSNEDRRAFVGAMKEELVSIGKALDLIDFADEDVKTLVYHIVFEGMRRKTEQLACGKTSGKAGKTGHS